jgi:hypothetical protein
VDVALGVAELGELEVDDEVDEHAAAERPRQIMAGRILA